VQAVRRRNAERRAAVFRRFSAASRPKRGLERDPQKWKPVLRKIALSFFDLARDLIGEPIPHRLIRREEVLIALAAAVVHLAFASDLLFATMRSRYR
jgi:hypothetical protein